MRIMAIDYGDARTGIAVSDALGFLAGETWTIKGWHADEIAQEISSAAKERGVEKLVLGYPLNMDGTAGPRAEKSLEFAQMLRDLTGLEVIMWDERRTTVDAHRILSDAGKHGRKRREVIDSVAATLILEGYLNSLK